MAVWTTKYINDLPDSSFAYIESGGDKDADGKTTPRGLRHLPYKDADGNVDAAHTRNALARLSQTDAIPASERPAIEKKLQNALASVKSDSSLQTMINGEVLKINKIELDQSGNLPTRVPLVVTGNWPDSVKGNFQISLDDLREMKANYDSGIGFPTEDTSTGLAIDFMHEYDRQAAAWIKGLEVEVDPNDASKGTLYSNPTEWTDAGAEAVQGGQFKMISPSGYFGKRNGKASLWANPTNLKEKFQNVLDGAGLTNIPFLRGMKPIRASATDDDLHYELDKVIFSNDDSQNIKGVNMTIDEVRVKALDALSDDEKKFLEEHKSELSAAEQKKFGLEAEQQEDELSEEDKQLLAAIKSGDKLVIEKGTTVVENDKLSALEKTAEQYRTEKATEVVNLHIKRGAIKQDQSDFWIKQLLSADEQRREELEAALKALPDNESIGEENGHSEDVQAGSTAREALDTIAQEKIKAAAKDGKEMLYTEALKLAVREHPELVKQDKVEMGVN